MPLKMLVVGFLAVGPIGHFAANIAMSMLRPWWEKNSMYERDRFGGIPTPGWRL